MDGVNEAGENTSLKTRSTNRPSTDSAGTPLSRLRNEIKKQRPDQIPHLVSRALETGDPILRKQLMAELYTRMDAGNYQQMIDEILRFSDETGREFSDEYLLMNLRAGQIAGLSAMGNWKEKDFDSKAAWSTFSGWAQVDPDAARQWMESNPDLTPEARDNLLRSLVDGAIIHDPDKAMRLFASLPEEERDFCLGTFAKQIVQNNGKEAGMDWLKTINSSEKDSPFAQNAAKAVFDRMLWSGANRSNAASMVSDLERLSTIIPIDDKWISRSMGQIRDRKTTGGIELLDQISKSPVLKDQSITDSLWNSAVDFALVRDPDAVSDWLAKNPDSPIHRKVAEMSERKAAQNAGFAEPK